MIGASLLGTRNKFQRVFFFALFDVSLFFHSLCDDYIITVKNTYTLDGLNEAETFYMFSSMLSNERGDKISYSIWQKV